MESVCDRSNMFNSQFSLSIMEYYGYFNQSAKLWIKLNKKFSKYFMENLNKIVRFIIFMHYYRNANKLILEIPKFTQSTVDYLIDSKVYYFFSLDITFHSKGSYISGKTFLNSIPDTPDLLF